MRSDHWPAGCIALPRNDPRHLLPALRAVFL